MLIGHTIKLPCDLSTPGQVKHPVMENPETIDYNNNNYYYYNKSINNNNFLYNYNRQLQKPQSETNSKLSSTTSDLYSTSDQIQLVLWYHGEDISGLPFYSVDARHNLIDQRNKAIMQIMGSQHASQHHGTSGIDTNSVSNTMNSNYNNNNNYYQQLQQHQYGNIGNSNPIETTMNTIKLKHFVVPPYSERATFELRHNFLYHNQQQMAHLSPTQSQQHIEKPALLTIQSVRESDAGLYWCRVDYRWTRTTISKVRLNVLSKFISCFFLFVLFCFLSLSLSLFNYNISKYYINLFSIKNIVKI